MVATGKELGYRSLTTTAPSPAAWMRRFYYGSGSRRPKSPSWQSCSSFSTDSTSIETGGGGDKETDGSTTTIAEPDPPPAPAAAAAAAAKNQIRLSKLLSHHSQSLAISRREAERLIRSGDVTVAGQYITSPHYLVDWDDVDTKKPGIVKVGGKAVALVPPQSISASGNSTNSTSTENQDDEKKIWIVHKLKGEVVADHDQQGKPSMMERLVRGGVGKVGKHRRYHLKPIGRLDMMTEGLILVTTCGKYAREMELPVHEFHRTYRVRVHGPLTQYKILAMQKGLRMDDKDSGKVVRFAPMKVEVEGSSMRRSTNCWIRMTCTEGKNRQIRNVLKYLGCTYPTVLAV